MLIVACDDRKTAVRYFDVLRREHRSRLTVHLVPAPRHGASPREVLDAAVEERRRRTGGEDDSDDQVRTWILVDLEARDSRQAEIDAIEQTATRQGVEIARSRPCFEVWTLLHLLQAAGSHPDCRSVIAQLDQAWRREFGQVIGKKAQMDFGKLMPRVRDAVERARRGHHNEAPSHTEVYRVVEEILRLTTG